MLVGDPQQLQPIQAGAAFRAIVEKTGYLELSDVRRQRQEWQRAASIDLSRGRVDLAIDYVARARERGLAFLCARERLADDSIGPRLVGSPQMEEARDWALAKYKSWNIHAEAQNWGVWRGWERGISHIDMVSPRVRSLEATQLAWCPGMGNKTVTAGLVILPDLADFTRLRCAGPAPDEFQYSILAAERAWRSSS